MFTTTITAVFAEYQLSWKPSSLQILVRPCEGECPHTISVRDQQLVFAKIYDMVVIDCLVSFDTHETILHRLDKATAAFWAHKEVLCCSALSLQTRLEYLRKKVIPWPFTEPQLGS